MLVFCLESAGTDMGAVESRFAPDELENATHLQIRLHRLWGDLLQDRSHRQVSKLKELVRSLDE